VSLSPRSLLARALAIMIVPAAALAIGAADEPGEARARLQNMSLRQRSELADALKQFDLQLTSEQQKSIRAIDEQISRLPAEEKVRSLAALRRYHNWLDSLPERVRDSLLAKPPGERMAQVKTLTANYPLPNEDAPYWMQFAEVAGASPFELAASFKIWQELTPPQRREIESLSAGARRTRLFEYARDLKLLRELRPPNFRADDWIPKVEAKIAELHVSDPELKTAVAKAELTAKRKQEAKDQAVRMPPLLRRLAINLYFLEQPTAPKRVDPERLAQFFAALPPWVRTSFDSYTADEARRRLTLVYRLVFPEDEFTPLPPGKSRSTSSTSSRPGSTPPPPVPAARNGKAAPKPPPSPTASPF
jgi:hypothetical protein